MSGRYGPTALMIAENMGYTEIAQLLREAGTGEKRLFGRGIPLLDVRLVEWLSFVDRGDGCCLIQAGVHDREVRAGKEGA